MPELSLSESILLSLFVVLEFFLATGHLGCAIFYRRIELLLLQKEPSIKSPARRLSRKMQVFFGVYHLFFACLLLLFFVTCAWANLKNDVNHIVSCYQQTVKDREANTSSSDQALSTMEGEANTLFTSPPEKDTR